MTSINDAVIRRFGEMSLSLCEAEAVIAAKDQRLRELEETLRNVKDPEKNKTGAEEMLESR